MKKHFMRIVLVGLFAISIGAAGAVFTALTLAEPAYGISCPSCDGSNGCVGSTCNCNYDGGTSFHCSPPTK